MMAPLEIIGFIASIVMGLSLGLIGGGGSILTVPILVYLFKVEAVEATAYSLFIVGLTALFGGVGYLKKKEVDLKVGFLFAVPSFIGVYLTRAYVVPSLPDPILKLTETFVLSKSLLVMLVFAVLMVAASVSMIKGGKKATDDQSQKSQTRAPMSATTRGLLIGAEGLVVGGVTGFVGAGGGFLIIPALVVLVGMPMKRAVGTSLFIIAAKSLIGFIGDLQSKQTPVAWGLILAISAIALVGLIVGMKLSHRVPEAKLKKGFGIFVLLMGSVILIDQLRSM